MNNSSKEVLKINKLNAIYPNTSFYVLGGLNLNINRGDRLALVGSSGCGKSTVAKAVMQLLPNGCVCDGEIVVNGKNLLDLDKFSFAKYPRERSWIDISGSNVTFKSFNDCW